MPDKKKPLDHEEFKMSFLQKSIFGDYLEEDEKVCYIIQTHWWIFFVVLFKLSIIFIPSLVVLVAFSQNEYVFLGSLAATLISASLLGISWYNLYADAFVLTNKNIIFVEWDSIVKINTSRISYMEIESASVEMEGLMSTTLGFGDLKIETANETFSPKVRGAEHASRAEQQILMNKEKYRKDDEGLEAEVFKKALRQIMDEYREEQKPKEQEEDLSKRFEKNRIRERQIAEDRRQKAASHEPEMKSSGSLEDIRQGAETIEVIKPQKLNPRFSKYRQNNQ